MVSLEQVKLLETKVIKTIEFVKKLSEENALLKEKLDSNQLHSDELEAQIKQFREDQNLIEDGILSALDRLNQFEDTLDDKNNQEDPGIFASDPNENASPTDDTPNDHDSSPEHSGDSQVEAQDPNNELDIF